MLMSKALSKASDVSILLDLLCIYCSNFSEKTCIKTGSLINAKFRQKSDQNWKFAACPQRSQKTYTQTFVAYDKMLIRFCHKRRFHKRYQKPAKLSTKTLKILTLLFTIPLDDIKL